MHLTFEKKILNSVAYIDTWNHILLKLWLHIFLVHHQFCKLKFFPHSFLQIDLENLCCQSGRKKSFPAASYCHHVPCEFRLMCNVCCLPQKAFSHSRSFKFFCWLVSCFFFSRLDAFCLAKLIHWIYFNVSEERLFKFLNGGTVNITFYPFTSQIFCSIQNIYLYDVWKKNFAYVCIISVEVLVVIWQNVKRFKGCVMLQDIEVILL